MAEAITIYNNVRSQWQLGGNTPSETFNDNPIDISKYAGGFKNQKNSPVGTEQEQYL